MVSARILSVDDDQTLNHLTKTALLRFNTAEMEMKVDCAYSAKEANLMLKEAPEPYAVILLDVIMEHPLAGFDVANYLRHDLNNHCTQIVMRSGQPGTKNRDDVMQDPRINHYYEKLELRDLRKLRTVIEDSVHVYLELSK
jgi:DNA-binding response OmpR family regulator